VKYLDPDPDEVIRIRDTGEGRGWLELISATVMKVFFLLIFVLRLTFIYSWSQLVSAQIRIRIEQNGSIDPYPDEVIRIRDTGQWRGWLELISATVMKFCFTNFYSTIDFYIHISGVCWSAPPPPPPPM
jgi:hypothetical protein